MIKLSNLLHQLNLMLELNMGKSHHSSKSTSALSQKRKSLSLIGVAGIVVILLAIGVFYFSKDQILANLSSHSKDGIYAKMSTSKGIIDIELYYQKTPLTVMNFVGLAEGNLPITGGKPFYDNLAFHRVVPDFVIQGGDPNGNGTGGPGYSFADEFHPSLTHISAGILSMANSGPDSNGSQFFITLKETPWLDNKHSVFGKVLSGMDVVNRISQGDTIKNIEIIRVGSEAEAFSVNREKFDTLNQQVKSQRKQKLQQAMQDYIKNNWPEAQKDPSGIYYQVLTPGTGATPKPGQQVKVHYQGKLINNQVFDDSYQRGEPIAFGFGAGQVIPGWEAALSTMKKGETRMTIIPPELAYGERGTGPIPGNSILVFKMELVDIK